MPSEKLVRTCPHLCDRQLLNTFNLLSDSKWSQKHVFSAMENRLWNTLWPVPEYKGICETGGSHSSISEGSNLQTCDAISTGSYPHFVQAVSIFRSRVYRPWI